MTIQQHEIRRRSNGTIDFDFYRNRALTERALAMTGALKAAAPMRKPFIVIAAMTVLSVLIRPDQFVG